MATLIGVVSQVIGEVYAVAGDGTRRPLSEGDRVFAGEQIVTGAAGSIAVAMSNGQQLTLGRDSSLNLSEQMLAGSSNQQAPTAETPPAAPSDGDLTDVEKLQAAIEAGVDPTLEGEATAAGPGAGGAAGGVGGGHSFVLLGETGGALDPIIGFPTEGLNTGPEFPNPDPVVADEAPDSSPTIEIIYFDQEGSVVTGPGVVEEAALNPDAVTNLDGQAGSNPGSNAENVSGSLIINSPDGISAIQVLDKDGVWINVQGGGVVQGVYGQLVFDAAGNWTYTLADNTLNHSIPDAVGADDQLLDPFFVRVFDNDGDVSPTVPLTIAVYDDGPTILRFDISEQGGLLVVDESVGTGGSTKDESGYASNNDETSYSGSETGVIGYASFNLESIFSLAVDPGADGENLEARTFSLTLSEDGADSGLTATAGGPILLSFVGGDGADAGDILGIADGGLVVFRISINSSTGAVSVTQYAAVDHGNDGNNHDSMAVIGEGLIGVTVKIFDNDGDSATSPIVELGSRIGFEDDGPQACIFLKGPWAQVTHDESAGLQNFLTSWWKPGDWDNDVNFVSAFNGVADKGGDIDPTGFARSLTPIVSTFGSSYGSDFAGATTVLSLELTGEPGSDSGLKTTDGTQINLYIEGGLVVGRVASGDFAGQAAFAVAIGADGSISIAQYMSLEHPVGGSSYDEAVTLAGKIKAVVTVTDGDGDVAVDKVSIGHVIAFEDDGPVATIKAVHGVHVVHDESHGLQNATATPTRPDDANDNDINGISNLFSSVVNRGGDLSPKGYAQSNGPLVTTAGSSYGQDQEGATSQLSLAVVGGNGADSGLSTTAGFAIKLYVENSLVVGRIVGGPDAGKAAFAIAIGADGTVSVAQYVSLQHPIGGSSYDEAVSLAGKVQAVLTVTDGDGDVAVDKVNIGSSIRFEDDGPTAHINLKGPWADVTHDETAGLQNFWNTWALGDITDNDVAYLSVFDGVANKGTDISPTGFAKSATPVVTTLGSSYGEDEEGATTQLSLIVKNGNGDDSGLRTTDGHSITLHLEGALIVGRIVGGADAGKAAFAIAIGADGSLSVAQYVSLEHPIGGSSYDEAVNLAGKIQAVVTVTDGDGDVAVDKVDIGSVIRFEDDGPTANISLVRNAGVTHDESAGLQNAVATPLIPGDANDNDVADLSALFAAVATPGTDLDPVGYAQSSGAVVSIAGSSTGQDDEGATTVLSLALQGSNGMDSGLKTTDGSTIRLHVEGELVVGRVDGGADNGKAAFAVAIGSDGTLSVAQYISLKHPDGSNADESLSLSGKIKAVLTVTDGDGDVAVDKVDIGHVIRFEDDAPTAGQVTAAVVLDDEGLSGGINGGPGDVAGAAISTSGNLAFNAGADGLKSIALSGPATLGTENVTSNWDATTNTLTISSVRGALLTVVLTDPATGAYTINLLQPLMHPVSGTEDDITLNIGYTVTDGDNDSATGSLVVTIDDDTPTIQAGNIGVTSFVTFQGTDAGFSNSYGYYTKAPDGSPVDGKVIWANVHAQSVGDVADLSGLDPANTGFFIIPNGGANAGLTNGSVVTFEFVAGQWQAKLGGVPLVGADGANVLFSDASLNPGGSHLQDTGNAGNQNWEDKTLTSDYDYNDVSTNITWGSALQVDESDFGTNATANFSGVFNVQPGADGLQSLTYNLSVQNANSGLVDTETNQEVILSLNAGVIEGRTSISNQLVFTLSVNLTGTVTLDQIRAIVHPTGDPDEAKFLGAGHVSLNAVVTDGDGDQASASLDIGTVISFKDDGPSVLPNNMVQLDDDALANGIPGGVGDDVDSINASGTLGHSFGADGAGSLQWLNTGAPTGFTYQVSGSSLLVKQGATTVLTVTLDQSNGAYTVTQNAPIQHATADQENNQAFTLSYQVIDKDGDTATGSLSINVDDDTPQAQDDVATVQASQGKDFNVAFVLDFSGSIDNAELNTMLQAVRAAGQALFNGTTGDVTIKIVAFSGTATSYAAVTDYATFSTLIGSLNPAESGTRPFNGQTDFTAAIQETMAVYTPTAGASNQVFFISDGNPNEQTGSGGNSLTNTTATAWSAFVNGPVGVSVTAIGVGNGINIARLQDVDLDGVGAPILVANFNGLIDTLLGQVGALVSGNVLLGSDGVAGGGDDDAFGADGPGYIQSIVINNVTYVWNGTNTITPSSGPAIAGSQLSNITTAEGGKLSFNFSTGAWTYQAPAAAGDKTETFTYTIVDKDGDPSSANLTVYVVDSGPVIAKVDEDELSGGITDGDAVTAVATGSVTELVVGSAAGVQFSLSSNTAGLPAASSGGTGLVYSVSGDTLTAKAGAATVFTLQVQSNGDYIFTLSGPLDHPLANGDDDELLVLNFASILVASNGVNPVTLLGDFLVHIEDDIPTITAAQATAGSLQVDETNLLLDATTNFSGAFNSAYGADGAGSLSYSLNVSAAGANSGLVDSATNQSILLYKEGANIVGKVGGAGGAVSFVVSVNSTTGVVTLDQQRALMHTPNDGPDQASSLASANLVQLVATITDKDGDAASATLNLGNAISFRDDAPSISAGQALAGSLQVDETNLAGNATASFSAAFTSVYGADGAGSLVYSLNVSAAGANSGLVDSATNQSILLYKEGANIVGKVGGAGGAVSFVVSVNSTTGVVTLDQQRALMHTPNDGPDQAISLSSANLVQLVATITDKDGDSASATLDLGNAISFKDDAPTAGSNPIALLDDDALPGGLAGGTGDDINAANTNGTLSFTYGADGAGSVQWLTTGNPSGFTYELLGSNLLVKQGATTVLTVTLNSATGAYSVTQNAPIMHAPGGAENNQAFTLNYSVTDKDGDQAIGSLNINVDDDSPVAKDIDRSGQANVGIKTNLMVVLDISGSMDDGSGVGSMTRLQAAKNALLELFEQYEALGAVKVTLVTFGSNATTNQVWVDIATAKSAVLALSSSGNTNYDAALINAINAFGQTGSSGGKLSGSDVQNVAYFLSDGAPNRPTGDSGIQTNAGSAGSDWPAAYGGNTGISEEQVWINFLTANNIRSYALGMGSGVTTSTLEPIAYNGSSSGGAINAIVVTDFGQLTQTLTSLAQASPLSGNLGDNGGGFGADGGYVRSLTLGATTYTYDKASNTVNGGSPLAGNTLNIALGNGSSLAVNMLTGSYLYTPPSTITTAIALSIGFTLMDNDGDSASANLSIAISGGNQPLVIRDDLVLSNVGTQSGSDVIDIPRWALLANDTGTNSSLLSVLSVANGSSGTPALNGDNVRFTENGTNDANGGAFSYTTSAGSANVVLDRSSAGSSTIDGTFRNEILLGRDGSNDTLNGGDGDDILIGLGGNDTLNGGNGNDILVGGAGNDTLNGGAGIDTASYIDATSAVTVNLGVATAQNTGGAGTDTLNSIENLIGSNFNDTLTGNNSANLLFGGAGNDTLIGNGGDDILIGGLGADTMTGGTGKDTFLWQKGGLGGGMDHITDFNVDTAGVNSDILDLSQLLSGVGTNPNVLQDYLDFAFLGTTTTISIRTVAAGPIEQQVMLDNVNLSTLYGSSDEATVIMNMLDDNALKTA